MYSNKRNISPSYANEVQSKRPRITLKEFEELITGVANVSPPHSSGSTSATQETLPSVFSTTTTTSATTSATASIATDWTCGPIVTFPERLMELLNNQVAPEAMWWLEDGTAFCIDPKYFCTAVLNVYFQGSKLESFTRKLNRWGFKRAAGQHIPLHIIAYYNYMFQRKQPELVKKMTGGKKRETTYPSLITSLATTSSTPMTLNDKHSYFDAPMSRFLGTLPSCLVSTIVPRSYGDNDSAALASYTGNSCEQNLLAAINVTLGYGIRQRKTEQGIGALGCGNQASSGDQINVKDSLQTVQLQLLQRELAKEQELSVLLHLLQDEEHQKQIQQLKKQCLEQQQREHLRQTLTQHLQQQCLVQNQVLQVRHCPDLLQQQLPTQLLHPPQRIVLQQQQQILLAKLPHRNLSVSLLSENENCSQIKNALNLLPF